MEEDNPGEGAPFLKYNLAVKVLVTGGAGFIGSHVVEELLRRGDSVLVLDDFSTGSEQNLNEVVAEVPGAAGRLEVVKGDVRDGELVRELVEASEGVIHLGAQPSVPRSLEAPVEVNEVNYIGTLNVLDAARGKRVKLVIASSSSVYGDTPELPKREDMVPRPRSPYAVSKLASELAGRVFWDTWGVENIHLRYFNVFGPRQRHDSPYAAVVPKFVSALISGERPTVYGDGLQTRDFTFVKDAANATLLALEKGEGFSVYNVAGGSQVSIIELLNTLKEITGKEVEPIFTDPRPGDVRHSRASLEKIGKELGYEPRWSLKEALRETVRWYERTL